MNTPANNLWPRRRSIFSHDWLKNKYMTALAKFLNLLDDEIEDPEFERSFVPTILPQWGAHVEEVVSLVKDFERCMSPGGLFLMPPLSGCDELTRRWLGDFVHSLWLSKYSVREAVEEALAAVGRVEDVYRLIQRELQGCADVCSAADLRPLRTHFAAFRELCEQLAGMVERLPDGTGRA